MSGRRRSALALAVILLGAGSAKADTWGAEINLSNTRERVGVAERGVDVGGAILPATRLFESQHKGGERPLLGGVPAIPFDRQIRSPGRARPAISRESTSWR